MTPMKLCIHVFASKCFKISFYTLFINPSIANKVYNTEKLHPEIKLITWRWENYMTVKRGNSYKQISKLNQYYFHCQIVGKYIYI